MSEKLTRIQRFWHMFYTRFSLSLHFYLSLTHMQNSDVDFTWITTTYHTHTHIHTHILLAHTLALRSIRYDFSSSCLALLDLPRVSHSGSCQPCWPPAGPKAGNGNDFYLILIPVGPQTWQTPALSPRLCTNSVYSWRNSLPFKPSHTHTHTHTHTHSYICVYKNIYV